jgi:hypothetical protein
MRRRAEETFLAQLALVAALGQVAMRLLGSEALRQRERNPVFHFRAPHALLSLPRRIWSSSIDSNSARKLPSPKPSSPLRWMISKKIGPIDVFVKICSRRPPSPARRRSGCVLLQAREVLAVAGQALVDSLRSRCRGCPGTRRRGARIFDRA